MPRNLQVDFDISKENYVIFASDITDKDTEIALKEMEVSYKKLQGNYKGEQETSFIVNRNDYPLCQILTRNQKSILQLGSIESNGMRPAKLKFKGGSSLVLGFMEHVTKEEAEKSDSYTYDPSTETYFIAR